jgi:hypothetical protein
VLFILDCNQKIAEPQIQMKAIYINWSWKRRNSINERRKLKTTQRDICDFFITNSPNAKGHAKKLVSQNLI